jgi:phage terminase large subunit-like protein
MTAPPATRSRTTDAVTAYADAVIAGEIVTNRLVRLACERHLADLATAEARGLRFDAAKAERAITFFGFLRLAEGPFAGKPFTLQPWQAFIVGSLFGWYVRDEDGIWVRRFRNGYVETGKGSGKTPLAAGIGLYGLVADDEAAAEIYSAAAVRDQASIRPPGPGRSHRACPRRAGTRGELSARQLRGPEPPWQTGSHGPR